MQFLDDRLVVSPSDLTGFLECEHLTQLELAATRGELTRPEREDPELEILARRGLEHEARHLDGLRTEGRRVVEFVFPDGTLASLREAHDRTVAAMRDGANVIYQATFFDGRWRCHADFLIRVDRPSALGAYSYEVADAKLARKAKASAVLQCCVYAEQLARIQGLQPEHIRLILGDRTEEKLRYKDYAAYYRSVKRRFERTVFPSPLSTSASAPSPLASRPPPLTGQGEGWESLLVPPPLAGEGEGGGRQPGDWREAGGITTYPDPVEHCGICRWIDVCDLRRRQDDHLCLVAGVRRDQTRRLQAAGITTVAALGASPVGQPVPGIGEPALERLRQQARLQVVQRQTGNLTYEVLSPLGPRLGFEALPLPSRADLFFDIEGDPFVGDNGLEYLFGIVEMLDGAPRYQAFWGHDPDAEKRAFEQVVDFLLKRLDRNPDLHVYHFAPYEPNALKWLASTYATREQEVDQLLRGVVLVDLYRVVRQSVRVSLEHYSLKELEAFYRGPRTTAIVDAAGSLVAYEDWLQSGEQRLLDEIARYNQDDCQSTAQLRDWLEARRQEAIAKYGEIPRPQPEKGQPSDTLRDIDERTAVVVDRLLAGVPEAEQDRSPEQQARYLLGHSLNWHRREAKSEWWEYYRKCSLTDEQLIEDREAIGGLEFRGEVRQEERSQIFRYYFDPNQEYKIGVGDRPHDPRREAQAGHVVALDPIAGWIELSRAARLDIPHPTSLIPESPIPTTELRDALLRFGQWVADKGFDSPGEYRAARDLLCLRPPRLSTAIPPPPAGEGAGASPGDVPPPLAGEGEGGGPGGRGSPLIKPGEKAKDAAIRLAPLMDETYLAIQGPPGSGKTTVGAEISLDLVMRGKRVGITANSHKVISHLLDTVMDTARRRGQQVRAIQKADEHEKCDSPDVRCVASNHEVEAALDAEDVDIVAGTPWLYSRAAMRNRLDVLVVDEAGQMALANVLAVAQTARNLILLGDPNQLRQPSHGIHPEGVDRSVLDHVIQDQQTMPREYGLFLETTFRLHPAICSFISEVFYDGKLEPDESTKRQALAVAFPSPASGGGQGGGFGVGLRFIPIEHSGNRTVSPQEVNRVDQIFRSLVGLPWTDRDGSIRPLGVNDILVVAPYNAHVRRLIEALPAGARVGTVDKFQGQEAPVVIYSMATSSIDDAPRGMDFLFSLNRLNVATSRAKGLVIVVCSPELLKARCRTPNQMRLASALCRFVESARLSWQTTP